MSLINYNKFKYMNQNDVSAEVDITYDPFSISVINHTDDIMLRPFGVRSEVTIEDLNRFYESRCFPKKRRNCKQLLQDYGLIEYAPSLIVQKTHGVQLEDYHWLKFEGEDLDYERDIKRRE